MKQTVIFFVTICMMWSLPGHSQKKQIAEKDVRAAMNAVDKNAIQERIRFLADDKLLGRLPGTPGYAMAVDFVVAELKSIGVKPGGENGFLQSVPLRGGSVDSANSSMSIWLENVQTKLRYGKDFTLVPDLNRIESEGEAPLVFAGYGITAAHLKHDDYSNLDVKGKIVVTPARGACAGNNGVVHESAEPPLYLHA